MKRDIRTLRRALLDLTGVLNRPQPDAALIAASGVDLDGALFPLLARIELYGPLGIVELAALAGRDYTTVSRQVTRLEQVGLVTRAAKASDARVKAVMLTPDGRATMQAIDRARERLVTSMLTAWDAADLHRLATLLRRFADDAMAFAKTL